MPALDALKEITSQLATAGTTEDIGRALCVVAKRFGMTNCIIVDVSKLFNRIGPALVFSWTKRAAIEGFDSDRPFALHPFVRRARLSEDPFVMSNEKAEHTRGGGEETWWEGLPPHLKHNDGVIVPVHREGKLVWFAGFVGAHPDLTQRALSVMSAAVHAGYARFCELLDSKTAKSPLSPRESECLRWVADGKTDFEVGKILHISPRTVRFHINNAKAKLGVATRIQAVAKRMIGAV